jgi:hypothetical protein
MMRKWIKRVLVVLVAAGVLGGVGYGGWRGWRFFAAQSSVPSHAIRAVRAKVAVAGESATVRLTVEMIGPGFMKEVRVPLLPPGVSLIEATIDGEPARMDLVNNRLAIVVSGAGRQTAELVYALRLTAERRLDLALPPGISTGVEISLAGKGQVVKAPAPAIVSMLPSPKGTLARIITPPTSAVSISWFPKPSEVITAARASARTETLYTIQGDSLAGRTSYELRIDGKDVAQLTFSLLENVVIDQVRASWVKGWRAEKGKLLVQAGGPISGVTQLVVHHRRSLTGGEVDLAVPELEGAVRQWGFGAIAAGGAVEISSLSVQRGSLIDPRGLPLSLRSAGAAQVSRAFRYDAVPSRQKLVMVRHQELATLEATCDSLNAMLAYTVDGRCIAKTVYTVRNARRQHLKLNLPAGAKLWSAYVAGKPVRPAKTEDGRLLVPLSCSGKTASRGFAVELVYFLPGKSFSEKGKFAAALPEVDVPVMSIMLSVAVPEDIHLEDFGGGLKQVDAFAFVLEPRDDKVIRAELVKAPRAKAVKQLNELLDQQIRKGVKGGRRLRMTFQSLDDNKGFQSALRYNSPNRSFVTQYCLENAIAPQMVKGVPPAVGRLDLTGFGQAELAEITGLASLSIAIPSGGRTYRFEGQLFIGRGPEIKADYWSALAAKPKADAEPRLTSAVAAVYSLSQHGLRLTARLDYSLDAGKVSELCYALPAGAKVISLRGSNLADWKATEGKLEVKLVRPERAGGQLSLVCEMPAFEKSEVELIAPRLASARSESLLVALGAPDEYELKFPDAEKLERLAPKVLPAELRNGHAQFSAFRLSGREPAGLRVRAIRHKRVAPLQATCDSVNAISFYTREGVGVTRVIWELRNSSLRHLAVTLPRGARLWGAFVADRAVKPLGGENGRVLLPLSLSGDGAVRSYPVEVVYIQAGPAFGARGKFEAELPHVNVPVMHAMYSLYLPRKLRIGRPGGTLRHVKEFPTTVLLASPSSEVASVATGSPKFKDIDNRRRYYSRQMSLELNVSQRKVEAALGRVYKRPAGAKRPPAASKRHPLAACGVKVYIPAVGQLLRFQRHLVVDGKLKLSCEYRG